MERRSYQETAFNTSTGYLTKVTGRVPLAEQEWYTLFWGSCCSVFSFLCSVL